MDGIETKDVMETAQVKEPSFPSRVLGLFWQPRRVFESLDRKPDWLRISILILVLSVLMAVILIPRVDLPEQLAKMRDNPNIPPERMAAIEERYASPAAAAFGVAAAGISTVILLVGKSALIFLAAMLFISTRAPFVKVFSIVSYGSLIGMLSMILKSPIMVAKGTRQVETSLALLVNPDESGKLVSSLLGSVDVFAFWELAVLTIGLSVAFKITGKKTAFMIVPLWVVWRVAVSLLSTFVGRS